MTVAKTNLTRARSTAAQFAWSSGTGVPGHHAHRPGGQHRVHVPDHRPQGGTGHADLAPADDDRLLFYREHGVAVFQVHAVERWLLFFRHPWTGKPLAAFMATWSYLIYDLLGPAASTGFLGYMLSETLRTEFGVNIPWWLMALAAFALIWMTHSLRGPAVDATPLRFLAALRC